jgi:hypothetical protein
MHCLKDTLLLKKPYPLIGSPPVFGDLFCEPVPVFRCNVLDFVVKILFHPLDFQPGNAAIPEVQCIPPDRHGFLPGVNPGISAQWSLHLQENQESRWVCRA